MIAHVVLYRYPDGLSGEDRAAFVSALARASADTGVVRHFEAGEHVPLPADDIMADSLFSLTVRWDFDDLDHLRRFSEDKAMHDVVRDHVRARGMGVAFANYEVPDRADRVREEVGA
jgi:hypothetical protein